MKATSQELELHHAIKNRDDIALPRLFDEYVEKVVKSLEIKYRSVSKRDKDLIVMAVNDAFLDYYFNPDRFNPQLSGLLGFLKMASRSDLINLLKKEENRNMKNDFLEDVELQEKFRNSIIKSYSSADTTILSDEIMEAVRHILEKYFSTETDIALALMILSKERETEHYVEVLEIGELTLDEQRAEVKKQKDRIKKVLERNDIENKIKSLLQ